MKRRIKYLISKFKENKKLKQVSILYLVNIIGIPIGIVSSILVSRFLGAEMYGDFTFILGVFNFAIVMSTFGVFQSGNRALVLNDDVKKSRELYGAELILLFGVFIVMSIGLYIYGFYDKNLIEKGLQNLFILLIPFSWILIFPRYFETLLQADNRINLLALIRFIPKALFLIFAGIMYYTVSSSASSKLIIIWFLRLLSFILVYIVVLKKINISFKNLKLRLKEIWAYNKSFGFHMYSGSVFSLGAGALTVVLIGFFGMNNAGVGFFGLALTFAMPLALMPNVIATINYKDFSKQKKIPKKLILLTAFLSLLALIFIRIVVGPFVRYFYGVEFESVIDLNFYISIGVLCHGFADFFNRFLGAHGKGKSLRNSSIINGVILLSLNLLLIPKMGEFGAAITKVITGFVYLLVMIFYYNRLIKKLN